MDFQTPSVTTTPTTTTPAGARAAMAKGGPKKRRKAKPTKAATAATTAASAAEAPAKKRKRSVVSGAAVAQAAATGGRKKKKKTTKEATGSIKRGAKRAKTAKTAKTATAEATATATAGATATATAVAEATAAPVSAVKAKKRASRKSGIYQLPKTPTAYLFFQQEVRPQLKQTFPEAKFGDLSKLVSASWARLTEHQKKPYEAMATRAKERRASVMEALPRPPKPSKNCYFLYSDSRRPAIKKEFPAMTLGDRQKIMGREWTSLSAEEQLPFVTRANEMRVEYEKQNASFYAQYPDYGTQPLEDLMKMAGIDMDTV